MVKIPRMTDRFDLKIGPVKFVVAPLSKDQKREVMHANRLTDGGQEVFDLYEAQMTYLKYGLKGMEGVEDLEGNPYSLLFDENGNVTDESLSEILMLPCKAELCSVLWQMLNSIPEKFVDDNGKKMRGVSLELRREKGPGS